jgi:hypothetical protein
MRIVCLLTNGINFLNRWGNEQTAMRCVIKLMAKTSSFILQTISKETP